MSDWVCTFDDKKTRREITNTKTGTVRNIPYASDKQWNFLQKLRADLGKEPLKNRQPAYKATKAINKLLKKKRRNGSATRTGDITMTHANFEIEDYP